MHPRNIHQERYDLRALSKACPELEAFVVKNKVGLDSINFEDDLAVRTLNRAILKHHYGIEHWELPGQFLCPPIPGRADYIHHLTDLFAPGAKLRGLDVGVGANCIYPLIGVSSYGWTFVGSDISADALASSTAIVEKNHLEGSIELRLQKDPKKIFSGIIRPGERFDFTLCNPPFHASEEEALQGTNRKWKNLKRGAAGKLNFGGKSNELWCDGGERGFVLRMIEESAAFASSVTWFTSLISKEANVFPLEKRLKGLHCPRVMVIPMSMGQKKSRILAWSFSRG